MSAGDAKAACGCCEGTGGAVPVDLTNRPGLSALAYRVGTHARFKDEMLGEISTKPALKALTTRHDDDPSIALLDAWAVSLDVLTFYQERIANEGFLRTAVERRSLLELARTIGYELRPGVASSTWLAFTLDGNPGSPREVTIPAHTRAQSLPTKSELPQSFETGEALLARPEWNALKPRQTEPQAIGSDTTEILLAGLATQLRPGDALLILWDQTHASLRILSAVEPRSAEAVTKVTWKTGLDQVGTGSPKVYALRQRAALFGSNAPDWKGLPDEVAQRYLPPRSTSPPPRSTIPADFEDFPKLKIPKNTTRIELDAEYPRIAPGSWIVLRLGPAAMRLSQVASVDTSSRPDFLLAFKRTGVTLSANTGDQRLGPRQVAVFAESEELALAQQPIKDSVTGKEIPLEGIAAGLARGRAIIVQGQQMRAIVGYEDEDWQMTLQVEGNPEGIPLKYGESLLLLSAPVREGSSRLWNLRRRDGVEGIVKLPFTEDPASQWFEAITLGPAEKDDPEVAEVAFLEEAPADLERTTLHLTEPLANLYDRTTVTINANVAAATHGETKREVLGAGDAAKRFQRFRLRQKPLTYTAAAVPEGGESTLELRVNGVLWHESPDLYRLGPKDRQYVLRRDDEGNTTVLFGDGTHGARLPSGSENVEAVYRAGIGLPGLVAENRISLLATRPLGVKSVTNPIPATGAADPQTRDQARRNAPMTVLTLDRVVSLLDFEDFARSFSGIGKAQARMLWDQGRRLVHLTVAGVGGSPVAKGSELMKRLRAALDGFRDPFQELVIDSYDQRVFLASLNVKADPDYVEATVLRQVEAALRSAFSFEARDFGQSVFLSEVMAVAQGVEGVVYVDVDSLRLDGEAGTVLHDRLDAHPARIDEQFKVRRAEILLLSPQPVAPKAILS